MTSDVSLQWFEALSALREKFPDATVSIRPHRVSEPVKPEKAGPSTHLRAWQRRVFPETPPLTGPSLRYQRKTQEQHDLSGSYGPDGSDAIRRTEHIERAVSDGATGVQKLSPQYDDPEGFEWHGPCDRSALSGLPCSHVHHAPSKDYIRSREARGRPYDVPRLMIATTQAENLSLKNSPALCLQEQRMRLGKHFRRRVDAGEVELLEQLEALRGQMREPDTPCLCPSCLNVTPIQRVHEIEATGRVQKPLPRPYGAEKRVLE